MAHGLRDLVVHAHGAVVWGESFPSKTTVEGTERRDEAREETRMYGENCGRTPQPRDLSERTNIRPAPSVVGAGRSELQREFRQLDEVMDCTDPARMATRDFYNTKMLSRVLGEDEHPALGRILTLELLARAVRQMP